MWYFQHKNLPNNYSWFIISIATLTHIGVLIGLFCFYRSTDEYFTILVDRAMPSTIDIALLSTQVGSTTNQKSVPHKINTPQKKIPAAKKISVQKQVSKKPTTPLSTKNSLSAVAPQKASPPQKKEIVPPKKNSPQPKQHIPKKTTEPIKTKEKEPSKKILEKEDNMLNQKKNESLLPNQAIDEECITVSSQELELLKKIDYLHKELAHAWHPPAIQKANAACTLELFVNWEGLIETIHITESSGVLIFDAAARKAAYDMHIPEWAKGKSITITLKA